MATAKQTEKEITFHNGQYRASVGYELKGKNGPIYDTDQVTELAKNEAEYMAIRKPKVWMLSADIRLARPFLDKIKSGWQQLKAETKYPVWHGWSLQFVYDRREVLEEWLTDHDGEEAEHRQLEAEQPARVKRKLPAARTTLPTGKADSHADAREDAAAPVMTLAGAIDA
jgi:hypothetical protein